MLGVRQELCGRQHSSVRMSPTYECFQAEDLAAAEAHLRLIVQHQLITLHGPSQLRLHHQASFRLGRAPPGIEHHAGRVAFALVHGRVGVLQQFVDVGAVLGV